MRRKALRQASVGALATHLAALAVLAATGCGSPQKRPAAAEPPKVKLAVLPAESDRFPGAARAITDSLTHAAVSGIDTREVSKVSLEVVQLSIECVEQTASCYSAVGKELAANRLLFAQIASADKKKVKLKVTVTLFDVDAGTPKTAERVFANEKEASSNIADLITEATR